MKKTLSAAILFLSALIVLGCEDAPRKEASLEDICASYKARLDQAMSDPKMTDQDRINMIPRLPGYADCSQTVGTGGLTIGNTSPSARPTGGPPDESQLRGGAGK